jgi:hypothetical protein
MLAQLLFERQGAEQREVANRNRGEEENEEDEIEEATPEELSELFLDSVASRDDHFVERALRSGRVSVETVRMALRTSWQRDSCALGCDDGDALFRPLVSFIIRNAAVATLTIEETDILRQVNSCWQSPTLTRYLAQHAEPT